MDRLTIDKEIQQAKEVAERLQKDADKQKGLNHGYYKWRSEHAEIYRQRAKWLEELKEYKQLEEQGLLLKLPYNIANHGIVYFVDEKDLEIYQLRSDKIEISKMMISNEFYYTIDSFDFSYEDFGKTVFLTKEEAEQALKEMEGADKS